MRKVFLSSTCKDLAEHRQAVCDAIEGLDGYYCTRMETFGARDWESADFCQQKVGECELFVGVLGHLYGSCPRGSDQSYTEYEYETAVRLGRSCLMFVALDNIGLPVNLREPDAMWQRQNTFRERVCQEQVRDTFATPQDLALKVIKAIRNWELEQQPAGAVGTVRGPRWERRYRDRQDRGPDLGSLVSKMCDRTLQEDEFSDSFSLHLRERPGVPQIYVLRGEESERPDSLVERFGKTSIQDYANYKWGEQKAAITERTIYWPCDGEPVQRQQRLVSGLSKEFDPAYEFDHDDFSATAFIQLRSLMLNPINVLQHEIRAAQWDQATRNLLDWYLSFWDAVAGLTPKPQFLIFFSILYPPLSTERSWRDWFKLSRFDKTRVETELTEIGRLRQEPRSREAVDKPCCPFLLLNQLSCVERGEVMNWFRRHRIYDDWNVWQSKCNEIFKSSNCRNMADIEYELKMVHREFIAKRGRL